MGHQYHVPQGNPCGKCGAPAFSHRVDHEFRPGKVEIRGRVACETCEGLLLEKHHRKRKWREHERPRGHDGYRYIGIDGEGVSDEDHTNHRYVLLGASNEKGDEQWYAENHEGLSTVQCLDFILRLPTDRTRVFSYAFNYDLTKILEDLDNRTLWRLFRPDQRQGKKGPRPVVWKDYILNLQSGKFTVRAHRDGKSRRVVIWDIFKFFQGKFVGALKDWKVGYQALWDRMAEMKNARGSFTHEMMDEIRAYCLEECQCMASLAHKLIKAHEDCGLKLTAYYGAGSSGGAMLSKMGIKDQLVETPLEMKHAVSSAFFGGRFENSVIGPIEGTIYDYDISSAYPYQLTFLPCLLHATWRHTYDRRKLDGARAALVSYDLPPSIHMYNSWGPFPFREKNGSISFPRSSGGGWVWLDEFLAGERAFGNVRFKEAWVYESDCGCQPFADVPTYYIQRLILGKEGPGIVLKLGLNSCYGKLAQSLGNPVFNNWIWAGMITSGTRAQIIDVMAMHKDRSNLLTIATDGIKTREKLITPVPRDTGTHRTDIQNPQEEWEEKGPYQKPKPLGGWEEKKMKGKGLFVARPGVYFPMNPTKEDLKEVKARGVGKGVLLENWSRIVDAWNAGGLDGVARVKNVARFCGAKTSIHRVGKVYKRAKGKGGKPHYGQWVSREVSLTFHPKPKRECVNADGMTLKLREFPMTERSTPYKRAMLSHEAIQMKLMLQEMMEQPDCDYTDLDIREGDYE